MPIDGKPTGKKNLFYYFVASERNPSEDPVVLWLNGGPGCSSFDGFVYEHGRYTGSPTKILTEMKCDLHFKSDVQPIVTPCCLLFRAIHFSSRAVEEELA